MGTKEYEFLLAKISRLENDVSRLNYRHGIPPVNVLGGEGGPGWRGDVIEMGGSEGGKGCVGVRSKVCLLTAENVHNRGGIICECSTCKPALT